MNILKWVACQFKGHAWCYRYKGMFKEGYTCEHCGATKYEDK